LSSLSFFSISSRDLLQLLQPDCITQISALLVRLVVLPNVAVERILTLIADGKYKQLIVFFWQKGQLRTSYCLSIILILILSLNNTMNSRS